jgi:plastocyanin
MNQTLKERQIDNRGTQGVRPSGSTTGLSWRRLLGRAAFGSAASIVVLSALVFKAIIPPLAVIFVLLAAGGTLAGRKGRIGVTGVVLAALGGAMFCGMGGSFVLGVIGAPEEPREFIPLVGGFVLALVVVVSAGALAVRGRSRGSERSGTARAVGAATVVILVGITVWSSLARMNFESAPAATGDIRVGANEFDFIPEHITASAGEIAVHVDNRGAGLHTFTIDSLGVDLAVPAGKSQRVSFEAQPGEFDFYCKLHPGMDGRLAVS